MSETDSDGYTAEGSQSDEEETNYYEVTCRRGHDDRLDVVTVEADDEKSAERKVKHENTDVRKIVPGTTVEVDFTESGGRRYGEVEDEEDEVSA